jgi:hypothetical protein
MNEMFWIVMYELMREAIVGLFANIITDYAYALLPDQIEDIYFQVLLYVIPSYAVIASSLGRYLIYELTGVKYRDPIMTLIFGSQKTVEPVKDKKE